MRRFKIATFSLSTGGPGMVRPTNWKIGARAFGRAGSMTRPQLCIVNRKPSTAAAYVEAALPKLCVQKKFYFRWEPVSRHTRSCPPVAPKKNPPQNLPAPLPSLVARRKIFLTDKSPIPSPPPTRTKHAASSSNSPAKHWVTLPTTSLTPSSNASHTRSKASSLHLSNSVSSSGAAIFGEAPPRPTKVRWTATRPTTWECWRP